MRMDLVHRLAERNARSQIERQSYCRKLPLMVDRQCFDLRGEMGERAQRDLRPAGASYIDLRQCRRILLELGLDLENDLVLVGRGVHRCDLALAERVVERLVDQRWRNAHPRSGVAVDLDRDDAVRRSAGRRRRPASSGIFFIACFDDRRPVIELFDIRYRSACIDSGCGSAARRC